jgi:hypothetical protein
VVTKRFFGDVPCPERVGSPRFLLSASSVQ